MVIRLATTCSCVAHISVDLVKLVQRGLISDLFTLFSKKELTPCMQPDTERRVPAITIPMGFLCKQALRRMKTFGFVFVSCVVVFI